MKRGLWVVLLTGLVIMSVTFFGCKSRAAKTQEEAIIESTPGVISTEETMTMPVTEPAQTVATETIPPTAAAGKIEMPAAVPQEGLNRDKEIQTALKNAGLYTGAIDGKIGPKTKAAIEEFQKQKGLKVDGKVGPKTWAELEKYLVQQ
ncbi:MAG: peptidoglycan-binding domain-containing protein [Candidatus Omnitrophota bacterium]